jgi:hypothetical protein
VYRSMGVGPHTTRDLVGLAAHSKLGFRAHARLRISRKSPVMVATFFSVLQLTTDYPLTARNCLPELAAVLTEKQSGRAAGCDGLIDCIWPDRFLRVWE